MKPGVPVRVLHNLGRASSTERPYNHTASTQEGAVRFSQCDGDLLEPKVSFNPTSLSEDSPPKENPTAMDPVKEV
jgi:hypothetical protein